MKYGARLWASLPPPSVPIINLGDRAPDPMVTDWTTVPPDNDPLGNDELSNCCYAAKWRWAQIAYGRRYNRVEPVSADDVVADYARGTGYDPATGAGDVGTDPNAMMLTWAENPNALIFAQENWPIVWARVRPAMLSEVSEAMTQTPLLLTAWLPEADADNPENWVNAPGSGRGWEGTDGHEMLLVRNGADGWTVRSWGRDFAWHPERLRYVHDLTAPLEATRADFARLGVDFGAV